MKYTNHLNIIIVVIGVIVIAQTLTGTFWNSAPEKTYSVEVPAVRPKVVAPAPSSASAIQKRSALPPSPVLSQPPVNPSSPVVSSPQQPTVTTPSYFTPRPVPLPESRVTSDPKPSATSPNVITIPAQPSSGAQQGGSPGETPDRSMRGQIPFGARSPVRSPSRDPRLNLPPPGGSDAGKRNPDSDAPAPPVRSSMPEQRVQ